METGSLQIPRYGHFAVTLEGGRVLVAGGNWERNTYLGNGELWDPHTGQWSLIPRLLDMANIYGLVPYPGGKALLLSNEGSFIYTPPP